MAKKSGIIYTPSSWIIDKVEHRGENRTYRVFENMTPLMTQDELIKEYGLQIPNSQLLFAIFSRDYELRETSPEAESLRQLLQEGSKQHPLTSTRVGYIPEGKKDKTIHNIGTSEQYSLNANVVGVNSGIKNISNEQNKKVFEKVLESILGTPDIDKINSVSQWVNGTDSYIWRLDEKPKQKVEKTVGFGAGDVDCWFYVDCNRNLAFENPSFRVERVE